MVKMRAAFLLLLPCVLSQQEYKGNPKLMAMAGKGAAPLPAAPLPAAPLPGALKPGAPLDVPLGQGTGNDKYDPIDPDHYTPDETYKAADKEDCHPVEKIKYLDECVPYVEKTCFTQQKESCKDIFEKNCTAVIDAGEDRECFQVSELICQLVETIEYEMVEETYTVQRCTRVTDRVCDTIYNVEVGWTYYFNIFIFFVLWIFFGFYRISGPLDIWPDTGNPVEYTENCRKC